MSSTTSQRDKRIDLGLSIGPETVTFSPRDWTAFLEGIDHPDQPRPRLEAAARRYQKRRHLSAEGQGIASDAFRARRAQAGA